ncbi:MAG: hypothetical protein JWO79_223 [Actinomycetia bacterium]|nr:hypothetical protein [Actinomycetes bacterium]MDQ1652963.1 hypothetical protein [Cryptosporangiaceae bacterium]MDQ1657107.1 hypothetical protein [Cryptosporangiaceae bacterium]
MELRRVGMRVAATTGAAFAVLAMSGGPALAHVKVSADKPEAGAVGVTVTFSAGAESKTAGIASLRTILPQGITPADVTYVSGPPGWSLSQQPDGFSVTGPPLQVGEDAAYAVRLAKIPAGWTTLPLKTVQRYGDGEEEQWLDTTKSVAKEEPNAAPALALQAAAGAQPADPAQPAPAQNNAAQTQPQSGFGQYPTTVWIAAGGAVAIALALILWVRSRMI